MSDMTTIVEQIPRRGKLVIRGLYLNNFARGLRNVLLLNTSDLFCPLKHYDVVLFC